MSFIQKKKKISYEYDTKGEKKITKNRRDILWRDAFKNHDEETISENSYYSGAFDVVAKQVPIYIHKGKRKKNNGKIYKKTSETK